MAASEVSRVKVVFTIEGVGESLGEVYRFSAPRTADALLRRLPVHGRAALWGEEVYFQVQVKAPVENPRSTIPVGSVGYWAMADSVCVFYGPTKPYSPVNLLGGITSRLELFRKVKKGTLISIKKG